MVDDTGRQLAFDRTEALRQRLAAGDGSARAEAAAQLMRLRETRDYAAMLPLAEQIARVAPHDHAARRLQAQALIETGQPSVAIDVLTALRARLCETHPEAVEAGGLLGRAWKDISLEAADPTGTVAAEALQRSFAAYRDALGLRADKDDWLTVNLLALSARAERLGITLADDLDRPAVARAMRDRLVAKPEPGDPWYWAERAELEVALGNWPAVAEAVRTYAARTDSQFQLASTMRQFDRLWGVDEDPEGAGILEAIRARLLSLPGGLVETSAATLQHSAARASAGADGARFEAVIGTEGPQTYAWWQAGLNAARAVASVRRRLGKRVGTAWLTSADVLGLGDRTEQLVVTNAHVVNPTGERPGIPPEEAEVLFEAADGGRVHAVAGIAWFSPKERHDIAVLRMADRVEGIDPLIAAPALPPLDAGERVYVVGHPGGRELSFSFQDNELLDHEGPDAGRPAIAGVCRIHYRAPTEGGSSGSPVFNAGLWQVIGVHHFGGQSGMPRLNGEPGSYGANEAISIASIAAAARAG